MNPLANASNSGPCRAHWIEGTQGRPSESVVGLGQFGTPSERMHLLNNQHADQQLLHLPRREHVVRAGREQVLAGSLGRIQLGAADPQLPRGLTLGSAPLPVGSGKFGTRGPGAHAVEEDEPLTGSSLTGSSSSLARSISPRDRWTMDRPCWLGGRPRAAVAEAEADDRGGNQEAGAGRPAHDQRVRRQASASPSWLVVEAVPVVGP